MYNLGGFNYLINAQIVIVAHISFIYVVDPLLPQYFSFFFLLYSVA